jgi:hypothetical protein
MTFAIRVRRRPVSGTSKHEHRERTQSRVQNFDTAYARRAHLTTEVLLQGRWRIEILCALRQGPVRLGQLTRFIPPLPRRC